jgi:hypothetical protein
MASAVKIKSTETTKNQSESVTFPEPKRLSKAGQWLRDNPGGIFIVKDWRAVNR